MDPATSYVPPMSEVAGPFWEGTRGRTLLIQWCDACEAPVHFPREACPRCLGRTLSWRPERGDGTVHAASVHYRPFGAMTREDCPYVVALVDLQSGVRFLANIAASDPADVAVGQDVALDWRPIGDGYHLPIFRMVRD